MPNFDEQMRGSVPLKVFCPVCDVAFAEEALVFEHLQSSHDLNTEMAPTSSSSLSAVELDEGFERIEDVDDWVLVGDEGVEEPFEEEENAEAWPDERLRSSLPSERERCRLIRHMASVPEKHFLKTQLELTFPNGLPERFFQLPLFGSSMPEDSLSVAEKRLLCVIAHRFPEIRFCPIIPSLVKLLFKTMQQDSERCLALLFALLQRKERLAALSHRDAAPVSLISTNETQLRMLVSAVYKLVLANAGKAIRALKELSPSHFAIPMCAGLFPDLPDRFREHIC